MNHKPKGSTRLNFMAQPALQVNALGAGVDDKSILIAEPTDCVELASGKYCSGGTSVSPIPTYPESYTVKPFYTPEQIAGMDCDQARAAADFVRNQLMIGRYTQEAYNLHTQTIAELENRCKVVTPSNPGATDPVPVSPVKNPPDPPVTPIDGVETITPPQYVPYPIGNVGGGGAAGGAAGGPTGNEVVDGIVKTTNWFWLVLTGITIIGGVLYNSENKVATV